MGNKIKYDVFNNSISCLAFFHLLRLEDNVNLSCFFLISHGLVTLKLPTSHSALNTLCRKATSIWILSGNHEPSTLILIILLPCPTKPILSHSRSHSLTPEGYFGVDLSLDKIHAYALTACTSSICHWISLFDPRLVVHNQCPLSAFPATRLASTCLALAVVHAMPQPPATCSAVSGGLVNYNSSMS